MNYLKTGLLLIVMTMIFLAVGYAIGGQQGMSVAFIMALGMNFFSYWFSDKMVLSMQRARQVSEQEAPEFYAIVREEVQNAGLPMPKVYLIDTDQPNAFATGRNPQNAAVAATTGLLRLLNREEIAGVMAHELGHVKHRDTLIMTLTAALAGAIGYLAHFAMFFGGNRREDGSRTNPIIGLVAMILAPIAAMLVQMAISRSREYAADAQGAASSGHPLALASALSKIEQYARGIRNPQAEANPATAHLFIINPLSGASLGGLFSTHPPTERRIEALRAIAAQMPEKQREVAELPRTAAGPWG